MTSRRRGPRAAAVLAALVLGSAVRADDLATSPEARGGRWYGYQTLASDAAAFALIAAGGWLGSTTDSAALGLALGAPGAALYLGGGPSLRVGHGDGPGAGRSVLRRLLLPIGGGLAVGATFALATSPGRSDICNDRRACAGAFGAVGGFGLGMITAAVVDAITAREPPSGQGGEQAGGSGPALAPALVATRGGALLGVRLAF